MTVYHLDSSEPTLKQSHQPVIKELATTNKVAKIFENIALAAGSLSIAMPLTLLVTFASGASAGLTGTSALAALCVPVLKVLGIAALSAAGTIGTFGLVWAIPVLLLGLSLLILHFCKPKVSYGHEVPIKWETR